LRKREATGQADGGREHPQHAVEGHAISHAVFVRVSALTNRHRTSAYLRKRPAVARRNELACCAN
jgi:hypothetical protein